MERSARNMDKVKHKREPIPEFETLEDIADFWDNHSTADYDDLMHEVHFDVKKTNRRLTQIDADYS
jgi:hypothetical protein